MPNPMMVLCVDGPLRGSLRATTETRFHAYDQSVSVTSKPAKPTDELVFDALTYHVHIISFLGFGIRVASMQLSPDKIDTYDVISTLFNESGRQATYRVNGPAT